MRKEAIFLLKHSVRMQDLSEIEARRLFISVLNTEYVDEEMDDTPCVICDIENYKAVAELTSKMVENTKRLIAYLNYLEYAGAAAKEMDMRQPLTQVYCMDDIGSHTEQKMSPDDDEYVPFIGRPIVLFRNTMQQAVLGQIEMQDEMIGTAYKMIEDFEELLGDLYCAIDGNFEECERDSKITKFYEALMNRQWALSNYLKATSVYASKKDEAEQEDKPMENAKEQMRTILGLAREFWKSNRTFQEVKQEVEAHLRRKSKVRRLKKKK